MMIYTDRSGQPWDSREECLLADRRIAAQRTEEMIDSAGLRAAMSAIRDDHAALVRDQHREIVVATNGLAGAARRAAASAVTAQYAPLITEATLIMSEIAEQARTIGGAA